MLSCSNLTIQYHDQYILKKVSVAVKPGEVTALIGPSGAGKSTLLRALACLEIPDQGSINLNGNIFKYPLDSNKAEPTPWPEVTAVFQQYFLWPHLTLRQNIALPLELRNVPDIDTRIKNFTDMLNMLPFIDRYPNEVSGGQRQRAALARALALQPAYLLLDEITSALDVIQAASIIEHLADLKRDGMGILMVTHHLGFLERAADTIVYIEDGEVHETGSRHVLEMPCSIGLKRFLDAFNSIEGHQHPHQVIS